MTVTVQYFKYPDRPHWRHQLERLGEDEHGIWLGGRAGTSVQRADEPPVTIDHAYVQLVAPDRWWSLIFNGPDHWAVCYVDIITPARWTAPDRVETIDLDLDVIAHRDGRIEVVDEDEFEEHRTTLGYPPDMVEGALAATTHVVHGLQTGVEPFAAVAAGWWSGIAGRRPRT